MEARLATEENTTERWLPVVGFEGFYEVSDCGRIRSLDRTIVSGGKRPGLILRVTGRVLRPKTGSRGYRIVHLVTPEKSQHLLVHRVVLGAFVGVPSVGQVCNHLDFNRENNQLANLEWTTQKLNIAHAFAGGRIRTAHGEAKAASVKLNDAAVRVIRDQYASGVTGRALAKEFGVSASVISVIVNRKSWRHVA